MSSLFLDDADLERSTGLRRPSAQRRWLLSRGYPHDVGADGGPKVLEDVVRARLGGKVAKERRHEPNWSALED